MLEKEIKLARIKAKKYKEFEFWGIASKTKELTLAIFYDKETKDYKVGIKQNHIQLFIKDEDSLIQQIIND